ncbi:MAG: response regulator [Dissulfurispiraceae bacterium]|jgi:two-component system, response regulator PdtaR
MKNSILNIMLIEDSREDAELIQEMLNGLSDNSVLKRADRLSSGLKLLKEESFHVVLLDLGLPDNDGLYALQQIRNQEPELPVIVLTGLYDETLAMEAISLGAQDYLVKGSFFDNMLQRSIRYSVERQRLDTERERLIRELQETLSKVKQLSGLLPICASCKKIRDDEGYWTQVEVYMREHTEMDFTHTVCPECTKKIYPEYYDAIWGSEEKKPDK